MSARPPRDEAKAKGPKDPGDIPAPHRAAAINGALQAAVPVSPLPPSVPRIYYDRDRRDYLRQNTADEWLRFGEAQIRRELRMHGVSSKPPEGITFSAMDTALSHLTLNCDVAYAAPLAGHAAGLLESEGRRILVTEGPRLIEPRRGAWPLLNRILDGMFPVEASPIGNIQKETFLCWMKIAHESLRAGRRQPGQALCLAGPAECGKTLLQTEVVTPILGGRMARPYAYMTGATRFNAEMFGAEHLAIDDEQASFDLRARRAFAAAIKQFTVADGQRCEAKYASPILLHPFWRVTITVNDEPEALGVLPPITPDLEDKIILLRARKAPMPMPTRSPAERAAFGAAVRAELPALLWDLEELEIPITLGSARFGVRHYHHPALREVLGELAPEARLIELMDAAIFAGPVPEPWEGTARELEAELNSRESTRHEVRRLLSFPNACGTYLGRLAAGGPHAGRVQYHRTPTSRRWCILTPSRSCQLKFCTFPKMVSGRHRGVAWIDPA